MHVFDYLLRNIRLLHLGLNFITDGIRIELRFQFLDRFLWGLYDRFPFVDEDALPFRLFSFLFKALVVGFKEFHLLTRGLVSAPRCGLLGVGIQMEIGRKHCRLGCLVSGTV